MYGHLAALHGMAYMNDPNFITMHAFCTMHALNTGHLHCMSSHGHLPCSSCSRVCLHASTRCVEYEIRHSITKAVVFIRPLTLSTYVLLADPSSGRTPPEERIGCARYPAADVHYIKTDQNTQLDALPRPTKRSCSLRCSTAAAGAVPRLHTATGWCCSSSGLLFACSTA